MRGIKTIVILLIIFIFAIAFKYSKPAPSTHEAWKNYLITVIKNSETQSLYPKKNSGINLDEYIKQGKLSSSEDSSELYKFNKASVEKVEKKLISPKIEVNIEKIK